jgi:hypothetical protein
MGQWKAADATLAVFCLKFHHKVVMRARECFSACLVLVILGAHRSTVWANDCKAYAAAPWTGVPYAYRFYSTTMNYSAARAFCSSTVGIAGSQLAISRNRESLLFMWANLTRSNLALTYAAYIGLFKNTTTLNWNWVDGQGCDWTDPNDERCYNSTFFDGSGNFGTLYNRFPWNASVQLDDSSYQPSAFLCEVPSKIT